MEKHSIKKLVAGVGAAVAMAPAAAQADDVMTLIPAAFEFNGQKYMVTAKPSESCAPQEYIKTLPFGDPVIMAVEGSTKFFHKNVTGVLKKPVPFSCLSKAEFEYMGEPGAVYGLSNLINSLSSMTYAWRWQSDRYQLSVDNASNSSSTSASKSTSMSDATAVAKQQQGQEQGQTQGQEQGQTQGQEQGQHQNNGHKHFDPNCGCEVISKADTSFGDVIKAKLNGSSAERQVALVEDIRPIVIRTNLGVIKTPFAAKFGQKLAPKFG